MDFRGEKRTGATHRSTTDPESRLCRKGSGREAKLCFMGHLLMEGRHGLAVHSRVSEATGTADRDTALVMAKGIPGAGRVTLGADKAYDTKDFVAALRGLKVTPHVARYTGRRSAIDGRTTRHAGYAASQKKRKRYVLGPLQEAHPPPQLSLPTRRVPQNTVHLAANSQRQNKKSSKQRFSATC